MVKYPVTEQSEGTGVSIYSSQFVDILINGGHPWPGFEKVFEEMRQAIDALANGTYSPEGIENLPLTTHQIFQNIYDLQHQYNAHHSPEQHTTLPEN